MSVKPTDDRQKPQRNSGQKSAFLNKLRQFRPTKRVALALVLLFVALLLLGSLAALYTMGRGPAGLARLRAIPLLGSLFSNKDSSIQHGTDVPSALVTANPGELVSPVNVLGIVGKSPVDPSRVLFAAFGRSATRRETPEQISAPVGPPQKEPEKSGPTSAEAAESRPESPVEPPGPAAEVITPEVVTRAPAGKDKPDRNADSADLPQPTQTDTPDKKTGQKTVEKPRALTRIQGGVDSPPDILGIRSATPQQKTGPAMKAPSAPSSPDVDKPEKYQLPGSLVVSIKNYKGTKVDWGLMVILDDSASMGRNVKPWDPNRMASALKSVQKLPGVLEPGSKMAVRDFHCGKPKQRGAADGRCMSRMLYDWQAPPFKGLKDKLKDTSPSGATNPCAAAAYSLKKDFSGVGKLRPRILLVTGGAGKCQHGNVLKALKDAGLAGKVRVDVVSLGIGKKAKRDYSALAAKTSGAYLQVDKPADLEMVLARYAHTLKTLEKKQMEVRGKDAVFKFTSDEEITLAPGKYTVTLPDIPGLNVSKRALTDIQIDSGQNRRLTVVIKNGRPVVQTAK